MIVRNNKGMFRDIYPRKRKPTLNVVLTYL